MDENNFYQQLFESFDVQNGRVTGGQLLGFFLSSGLNKGALSDIWDEATENKSGWISFAQFVNAMKLISLAQRGIAPKLKNVDHVTPIPQMKYPSDIQPPKDEEKENDTSIQNMGQKLKKQQEINQKIKNYESKISEIKKYQIELQEKCKQRIETLNDALKEKTKKCKILQAENEKQKEQIVTMEAVQVSFDEQLKQKHNECKELKQKLTVFETMQSIKTKHFSEWNSDAFLMWIMDLNAGKFKKYEKKLKMKFAEQNVDGRGIQFLKDVHLESWGVVDFMDRVELHQHVQDLIKKKNNPKIENNFDDQAEGKNDDEATNYL